MNRNTTIISGIIGLFLVLIGLINSVSTGIDVPTIFIFAIGSILIIIYVTYNTKDIKILFSKRSTQYLSNAIIRTIIVFGIIVILNVLGTRYVFRYDVTGNKLNTLSEQSIRVAENLDRDVKIITFFRSENRSIIENMIGMYMDYTNKIDFYFYDPDKNPDMAARYDIQQSYSTVVLETSNRIEKVELPDRNFEQPVTNALIKVSRDKMKSIFFMTGHGEKSLDDLNPNGIRFLGSYLQELNYNVGILNTFEDASIPENLIDVVVIDGPYAPLLTSELELINDFISKGGKVLFLLDPNPSAGMIDFFDSWGIVVGDDVVFDFSDAGRSLGQGPETPLIMEYNAEHPITSGFDKNTLFVRARSVIPKIDSPPTGVFLDWLCRTSQQSWAEKDYETAFNRENNELNVAFDEGRDIQGPVTVGAVAVKPLTAENIQRYNKSIGALVVFGDSDFSSNNYFGGPNGILFMNALHWLAEEQDLVAIPPKRMENRRVDMTAKEAKFVLYLMVIIIPSIIILFGLSVFFKRRGL
ncbi:GldG family protein [candidate division KSB1 bacterium]